MPLPTDYTEVAGCVYARVGGALQYAGSIVPGTMPGYGEGFYAIREGQLAEDADHFKHRPSAVALLVKHAWWRKTRRRS